MATSREAPPRSDPQLEYCFLVELYRLFNNREAINIAIQSTQNVFLRNEAVSLEVLEKMTGENNRAIFLPDGNLNKGPDGNLNNDIRIDERVERVTYDHRMCEGSGKREKAIFDAIIAYGEQLLLEKYLPPLSRTDPEERIYAAAREMLDQVVPNRVLGQLSKLHLTNPLSYKLDEISNHILNNLKNKYELDFLAQQIRYLQEEDGLADDERTEIAELLTKAQEFEKNATETGDHATAFFGLLSVLINAYKNAEARETKKAGVPYSNQKFFTPAFPRIINKQSDKHNYLRILATIIRYTDTPPDFLGEEIFQGHIQELKIPNDPRYIRYLPGHITRETNYVVFKENLTECRLSEIQIFNLYMGHDLIFKNGTLDLDLIRELFSLTRKQITDDQIKLLLKTSPDQDESAELKKAEMKIGPAEFTRIRKAMTFISIKQDRAKRENYTAFIKKITAQNAISETMAIELYMGLKLIMNKDQPNIALIKVLFPALENIEDAIIATLLKTYPSEEELKSPEVQEAEKTLGARQLEGIRNKVAAIKEMQNPTQPADLRELSKQEFSRLQMEYDYVLEIINNFTDRGAINEAIKSVQAIHQLQQGEQKTLISLKECEDMDIFTPQGNKKESVTDIVFNRIEGIKINYGLGEFFSEREFIVCNSALLNAFQTIMERYSPKPEPFPQNKEDIPAWEAEGERLNAIATMVKEDVIRGVLAQLKNLRLENSFSYKLDQNSVALLNNLKYKYQYDILVQRLKYLHRDYNSLLSKKFISSHTHSVDIYKLLLIERGNNYELAFRNLLSAVINAYKEASTNKSPEEINKKTHDHYYIRILAIILNTTATEIPECRKDMPKTIHHIQIPDDAIYANYMLGQIINNKDYLEFEKKLTERGLSPTQAYKFFFGLEILDDQQIKRLEANRSIELAKRREIVDIIKEKQYPREPTPPSSPGSSRSSPASSASSSPDVPRIIRQ